MQGANMNKMVYLFGESKQGDRKAEAMTGNYRIIAS